MLRATGALALCFVVTACSDGVSVEQASTVAVGYENPALGVNDPVQRAIEPQARPWIGTLRQRVASCGELAQASDEAFATDGFSRGTSEAGEPFLVARDRVQRDTPEYIEFCVRVPALASYRITARALAPDVDQDSFFLTVDEDAPGSLPEPFIYDVMRSDAGFVDDIVRSRVQDPLTLALDAGEHVLRFYYRERNTALAGIRLVRDGGGPGDSGGPGGDPDPRALAQCAANTGLSEARIQTLIDRHLGDAQPAFSLQGVPVSFTASGESESRVQRVNWFFGDGTTRANVLCLSEPPARAFNLIANTVSEGRLVIGSAGPDRMRIGTPLRGTLIGNAGDDNVEVLENGRFEGGAGSDSVALMSDDAGVFDGGGGADLLRVMEAGRFDGGAGEDRLLTQFAGSFDGGAGEDTVERQSAGASAVNVENVGIGFTELAPPSELRFVDATTRSAVLRWLPSVDERTDGYLVTLVRPDDTTDLNELGAPPESVSLRVTSRPAYVVDRFDVFAPVVRVYAFERLDDGSTLYSEPASLTFEPGSDADFLNDAERIAELALDTRFLDAALADDGDVVISADQVGSGPDSAVFRVFDNRLSDERSVPNSDVGGRGFRAYQGTTRQYVVPSSARNPLQSTAIGFDGDASTRLWQRDITVPVERPSQAFQRCLFAIVTQDDWLLCTRVQGGVQLFDPDGDDRRLDDVDLLVQVSLIDGENGRLAVIEDDQARPFQAFTRIDSAAATSTRVEVDLSARLSEGDVETEVLGLAVVGDDVVLSGAILGEPCGGGCSLVEGVRTGYFLARVALSDGRVLAWQRVPLDQRPGTGIGRLSPDRASVVFGRQNVLTRHDIASLTLQERRRIPGSVEGIGDSSILVQSRQFSDSQPTLEIGSRFYLLTP